MKQIPNIFTLFNLFFGCLAIVFALQTDAVNIYQGDNLATSFNMPEKLAWAAICILISAVIDFLDGFVARIFNAVSEMGKQLDSLSDIVSFGAAPSMILYQFLRLAYMQEEDALATPVVLLVPAFLFAMAGAYRLARFNLDASQSTGFKGVPIPAAGILVASLPLIAHYNYFDSTVNAWLFNKWVIYLVIVLLSYLMVSRWPLMALKFGNKNLRHYTPFLVLAVIALISAIFLRWMAVPVVFVAYIALSLLFKAKNT